MDYKVAYHLHSMTSFFPVVNQNKLQARWSSSLKKKKKKILSSINSYSQLMLLHKIQKIKSSNAKLLIHRKPGKSSFDSLLFLMRR